MRDLSLMIIFINFVLTTKKKKTRFLDGLKPSRNWKKNHLEKGLEGFSRRFKTVQENGSVILFVDGLGQNRS
jgi:hypothetical protein